MPTVDREGLREALGSALFRKACTLADLTPPFAQQDARIRAYWLSEADALIATGFLAPILAQADTAAQAVADRDEYAEYIIDLECKATRDAGQIARLSAEVERLRAALDQAEACLSIVEPRTDRAEYLRTLDVVRTALAAGQDKEGGKP